MSLHQSRYYLTHCLITIPFIPTTLLRVCLDRTLISDSLCTRPSMFSSACGAVDGNRTRTTLLPRDFKSLASANSATTAYKMISSQWTCTIGNKGRVSCMHPLSYERFELVITKSITALCLVTSYSNTFKNYHHPQEIRTPHTLPGLHYPYAIVGLNSATSQFTIVQMVSQVNHYHFHCRYTWVLPCLLSLYVVAYQIWIFTHY